MLIAHVSDLHLGRHATTDAAAARLARALADSGAGAVVVSGDVTHRGRHAELARFEALFRPLLQDGRVVVVPGNHDRLGDDAASAMMPRRRVTTWSRPGLHVVRIDSTAAHNRWMLRAHGELTREDLAEIDRALHWAPPGAVVVAALHHHLHPLPADLWAERLGSCVGLPFASELSAGRQLLDLLRGRCDLVLHGHRHRPSELVLDAAGARPLRILNAGSSTGLERVRTLSPAGAGRWVERWIDVGARPAAPAPWRALEGRVAA